MDIETTGFVIGVIGAVLMKASMGDMRRPIRAERDAGLDPSMGRAAEPPGLKAFLRGLALVLTGLGLETYARLFIE